MKKDDELTNNLKPSRGFAQETGNIQSLQDKTGATAEQIRRAIEILGFDRDRVEEYLLNKLMMNSRQINHDS